MAKKLMTVISPEQARIIESLRYQASTLLDCTPRFRYFTLHGQRHIDNLFSVVDLLVGYGLKLSEDQAFLLSSAICVHDLGMVVPLSTRDLEDIFGGKPQTIDPANIELEIRSQHHELIAKYIEGHFDFLLSLGISPPQCAVIREIARCHRKIDLSEQAGHVRSVGALLRIVDELDTYSSRAPAIALLENYGDMDATSCWHWFKHNICQDWQRDHNVLGKDRPLTRIVFKIAVHPPRAQSIPYWLNQIRRPLHRVLFDEGVQRIVLEAWQLELDVEASQHLSSASNLGVKWEEIEQKALSSGRKVILVIDDEVRKMEDLFLPLMQKYHVIFAPNARDALDKLNAAEIDFAIVDLQVGSGARWTPEETHDYKMTGVRLCQEIKSTCPNTKIGILTGSRHDLSEAMQLEGLEFLLKKPVDPDEFEKEVDRVLN